MKKTITSEIVVGYSQCPSKAYLLLCTEKRGTQHEYMQILEKQRQIAERNYIDNLRQENADVKPYSLDNLKGNHQYLVDATLEADGFSAKCAVLSKVRTHSAFGHYSYEPTIVVGSHTIKKEHRLEIFFVSYVLELVQEKRPVSGYIVGLDGKSHRVKLENGSKTLNPFLEPLQEWVAEETPDPPSLILNKNCPACQFRDLCREKAIQEDNLSLLDGISTQKAINKYEKKGLFTVKQLSYTFKPRKRKKRAKNPPPVIHKPELQALAIREQKIYLQELPELTRQPVEIFLDIEGIPDQKFYYLIGLLICENDTTTYHPFWADTPDDELQIWGEFLDKVNQYPDTSIYHYGNYDARALKILAKRYDTKVEDLTDRLVNVNKHIYGKVYFPVYSNRLKEIGAFIGATWTAPNASGLQSLIWRMRWDENYNIVQKDSLLTYNEGDCRALCSLANELTKIEHSAHILSDVDFADKQKQFTTDEQQHLHSQFGAILKFAHFGYDKNKICFRQGKSKITTAELSEIQRQKAKKQYEKLENLRRRAKKIVQVPFEDICPKCGYRPLKPLNSASKRFIVDLLTTSSGIRKTITQYIGKQGYCKNCKKISTPVGIRKFGKNRVYGAGFRAWVIYQRVALRLPYEKIMDTSLEYFKEEISISQPLKFLTQGAIYYTDTKNSIAKHLLESPYVHVDETKVNIKGVNQYVWVFTNGEYVIFDLSKSREPTLVHEFLGGYEGILISDFYPGYDSVDCKQQKCWVHLIRDINDDLKNNPFDGEFEAFVLEIRNLIIPIMETIQKYGLRKRNLNKFKKSVEKFYQKAIVDRSYKSDLVLKYQKRFTRYHDSLFSFLDADGIPWHNNTAERAIRPFAIQRDISKSPFHETSTRNYLVLLSISQTCRFQGKSFFKFLFSGETDLDKFEAHKRKRRV
jgi:predicted RecB family nuclease